MSPYTHMDTFTPPVGDEVPPLPLESPEQAAPYVYNHWENLAESLPYGVVQAIGMSLKEEIQDDLDSQQPFFDAVTEAVAELGIAAGGARTDSDLPFKGASAVQSMALFDSLIQVGAIARQHLYKAEDMVDTRIIGMSTQQLEDIAQRKKLFFNYYLTEVSKEFRKESIRTILWTTIAGSIYKKVYIDPVLGRPTSIFIPVQDFIVNRSHATHHAAVRKTHRLRLSYRELQIRRMQGFYKDIPVDAVERSELGDQELTDLLNEISGYQDVYNRGDREFVIDECHVERYIAEDPASQGSELPLPYIISLDAKTGTVLAIRRNWEQNDPSHRAIPYFVNFSFFPSLDGEGYGFSNYAVKSARAATTLTRELVNSALYSNFPGGVVSAGLRIENNNIRPAPGEWWPLQTGGLPIKDNIMPMPYKEPSPALHDLRNELEQNIQKPIMMVTQDMVAAAQRAPQGTMLFLMEQMHKVPCSLLQNFYESFDDELDLLNKRLEEWMPANQPYPFAVPGGQTVIMKSDFAPNIKVYPASDPSVPNSAYRMLQSELILQTAEKYPQLHNVYAILQYYYQNMGLGNEQIQGFLPPPQEKPPPKPLDPISENANLLTQVPVVAGIQQDHAAHITVHQYLLNHEDPTVVGAVQAHIRQHEAMQFTVEMYAKLGMPVPQDPAQIPPDMQNQIAMVAAQAVSTMQQNDAAAHPTKEQVQIMKIQSDSEIAKMEMELRMQEMQNDRLKLQAEIDIQEKEIAERRDNQNTKLQLEDQKFQHDKILKEADIGLKTLEMNLKHAEDRRKQEQHVRDLSLPPTQTPSKGDKND